MADVRRNIGGLSMALNASKYAYDNREMRPLPDPYSVFNVGYDVTSDVDYYSTSHDIYIWGIHKWGDTTNKVGE